MKKVLPILILVGCLAAVLVVVVPLVSAEADELEKTTQALNAKKADLGRAQKALEEAKKRETSLASGVGGLQASLDVAIAEATVRQAEADAALADFERQDILLKEKQAQYKVGVRELYKQMMTHKTTQVATFLDSGSLIEATRIADYQNRVLENERERAIVLAEQVANLEQKKIELKAVADKAQAEKVSLEKKMASLKAQIANARYVQSSSNNAIASINRDIQGLSAEQQKIINAKLAASSAGGSVGDVAIPSTPLPAPSFGGDAFAIASYGVPHRVGLSQYGAAGRAYVGQNYAQIIPAYFHNVTISTIEMPGTIEVQGVGAVAFEDRYLKLVREMPRSWPLEALKTQAILARTYAYKWIRDGRGAICTNQNCQVYKHSDNPDSQDQYDLRWFQAVAQTRGMVLQQNNYPIGAYYASTSGGISQQSGQVWSVNLPYLKIAEDCDGGWPNNCYETRGGSGMRSPWFHKPWGDRDGKTENSTGTNCPTCNPWMTKNEMIDLFVTAELYGWWQGRSVSERNASTEYARIKPIASGGMSTAEMQAALVAKGIDPLNSFSVVDTLQNKSIGQTSSVRAIGGNRGVLSVSATNFKAAVNLRSPGTIHIRSTLFDIIRP